MKSKQTKTAQRSGLSPYGIAMSILMLLLCSCICFSVIFANAANGSSTPELTLTNEFEEEYAQGGQLTLPEGTISVGDDSAAASVLVKYPGGDIIEKEQITLDRLGKYEAIYSAELGGKTYSLSREFYVYGSLYSFSGRRSSAEYVTGFSYENNGSVSTGSVSGLKVSLAMGETFTFEHAINVSDATALDKLLSMVITPEVLGEPDVQRFSIILTDATDASNYITITAKIDPAAAATVSGTPANNQQRVYVAAGARFQPLTGIEFQYNPPILHAANNYGAIQNKCSLFGTLNNAPLSENVFDLRLDYAERSIHISNANYAADDRVTDLDDPYFYSNLWDGFALDEAYVSIKAESYQKEVFNFIITDFVGSDDLTSERYDDKAKPGIEIDTGEYGQNVPNAVIGKPYPLFSASAYDSVDGDVPVSVNVYRNYTSNRINEGITDGCFVPTLETRYTIEYSAEDASGNEAVKTVTVVAVPAEEVPINLAVDNDRVTAAYYGEQISVADYTVSGGVSQPNVTITASCGSVKADVEDGVFMATAEGTWTVSYTAADYAGQSVTVDYEVTVTKSSAAVFTEEPVFPKYLIAGEVNEVPECFAYDYMNGEGIPVSTVVKYVDKDGEHTADDRRFTPNVNASGDLVTVKYVATVNGKESSISAQIPAYKITQTGSVANVSDYFALANGATASTSDTGAVLKASSAGARAEFINPLVAGAFSVEFSVNGGASDIKLTFTDSLDASQRVSILLTKNGAATDVIASSGVVYHIYSASYGNGTFQFTYDNLGNILTVDAVNSMRVPFTVTDLGEPFSGFTSGKVYLSFEFAGDAASEVTVSSLGNQNLSKSRSDSAPQLYMGNETPVYPIGSIVHIQPAYAGDIFDPTVNFSMTVTKYGESTPLKDVNGKELKDVDPTCGYDILMDEAASYYVTFSLSDQHGNAVSSRGSGYIITAVDDVAPVIEVSAPETEVAVGDTVYIHKATVTDNIDSELQARVYLVSASGILYEIGSAYDGFVADRAGVYTLMYVATDSAGNTAIVSFSITAEVQ